MGTSVGSGAGGTEIRIREENEKLLGVSLLYSSLEERIPRLLLFLRPRLRVWREAAAVVQVLLVLFQ